MGAIETLLPYQGQADYHGPILSAADADGFYHALMNHIEWENDAAIIYGKKIITKRQVAWYADHAFAYTYSQITKIAKPWTSVLKELKTIVEQESGEIYNACLLNLYPTGREGMAWHSDAEKELKKNGAIASLSFGAERKFAFKHKITKDTVAKILQHGSLLVMKSTTQSHWLHCLPPTKKVATPRINLTFRTVVEELKAT